jgi:hydrogenase 3 maturation protease
MLDQDLLKRMLSGRVVIACVGNDWRGDEGVGRLVAGLITPSDRASVVDCGETPENYLGVIADLKPERLIVLGAVDFGGAPGGIRVLARREIGGFALSTLAPRLTILTDYVETHTGAETFFIAIQPETLEFGAPLGATAAEVGRALAQALNDALGGGQR